MMQSALAAVLDVRTPSLAPLGALAFLGTGAFVVLSIVGGVFALAARRFRLSKALLGASLAVAVVYATLLLGVALVSGDRVLKAGERKYFCEMDCHLAYSLVSAAGAREGRREITVRTWFDPGTIAAFRGNAPLSPNPREVYLADGSGHRYEPLADPAPALSRSLAPGDSYETTVRFSVPPTSPGLRLFVGDAAGLDSLVIGHENGPLHGKTYFELPE